MFMVQPGDRLPAPPQLALVQDLLNSVDLEEEHETLRTPPDLEAFTRAHDLDVSFTTDDVAAVHSLREALRDVCAAHGGHDIPAVSIELLHRHMANAPLLLALDTQGMATAHPPSDLTGLDALTAALALAILTATIDDTWPRLKACSNPVCRWAYYDRSPSGRSRWCTMNLCGSRAKMRTYRDRANRPAQT